MRPRTLLGLVTSMGLLAAGCSSESPIVNETSTSTIPVSETSVTETPRSTISAGETSVSETSVSENAVSESSDVVYMTMNGVALALDVFAPIRGGPWPVVVAFHGRSSAGKDADGNEMVPEAAAARGMVVVTPTWYSGDPFPLMIDDLTMMRDAGNCAVAFAQQIAPEYGGDASTTVVYGFSAGTGPALTTALGRATFPFRAAQPMPRRVRSPVSYSATVNTSGSRRTSTVRSRPTSTQCGPRSHC